MIAKRSEVSCEARAGCCFANRAGLSERGLVLRSVYNGQSITTSRDQMRCTNRETAAAAGLAKTGARIRKVVQATVAPRPSLEPQTGLSHLLQPQAEKKDEKAKRRFADKVSRPLEVPEAMNECWSADFMSDAL